MVANTTPPIDIRITYDPAQTSASRWPAYWEGRSASVASQSEDIEASTGEGIVVDYTTTGYRACSTGVAVEARGNRNEVERRGGMKPLEQLLVVDFLECRIGKIGLFFDPETERYFEGDNMVEPRHAITTRVVARRRAG